MIAISVALGTVSAVAGYLFALSADVSIAGAMATTAGIIFGLILGFCAKSRFDKQMETNNKAEI